MTKPLDHDSGVAEILHKLATSTMYTATERNNFKLYRKKDCSTFMCLTIDIAVRDGVISHAQASQCMRSIISFIGDAESPSMWSFIGDLNLTPFQLYTNWNTRYTLLNHAIEERNHAKDQERKASRASSNH